MYTILIVGGRLSFEALTPIHNWLNSTTYAPSLKESLVDANNRFFTIIPSICLHVIKDEEDFLKVQMLEAPQDIEIASRVVGFDMNNDESIDEKYKKQICHVSPLSHDSEDYRPIEKYIRTTHVPSHTERALELEKGSEFNKDASYQVKLKNKMPLRHFDCT
ncbi:poly [ADP-ribose] polymerase 1 [Olea europaea subsp. europaea]|uniref:Poly [ADP-ribose] polymerase 1 n=1 Tax=Olea europaea subsp. europaea TaxID=158383 RepID=A0A8S0QCE7_OLEEU|nr:poly [ADP-ribose] polymerase 1 [Olea europaea subsp. europaea]